MKQLITISQGGGMTSLRCKRGQGLDLRRFGPVSIERSSLIEFEEEYQGFKITLLNFTEKKRTQTVTKAIWELSEAKEPTGLLKPLDPITNKTPLLFREYEDAVACEVEVIQGLRKLFGKDAA